ncbi:MAG: hypothetical protein JO269_00715 [Burkholderiaceae bacterium]|nr:hypothetical protein [Burkholderiaceae bacterium]
MAATAVKKTAVKAPVAKKTVARKPAVAKAVVAKQVSKAKPAVKPAAKPSAKVAAKPSAKPAAKAVAPKAKKIKLVRDSFSMPENEYAVLGVVKKACLKAGIEVKKSELLRIGVALIRKTDLAALKRELAALAPLKAGRPKKDK